MSSDENDVKFELDFTEPSQEVLEYGRKRVGENPDTRSQVISDFRDLIYGTFFTFFFVLFSHALVQFARNNRPLFFASHQFHFCSCFCCHYCVS